MLLWAFILFAVAVAPLRADDVLFIGNSFTFAAEAPNVERHGGVPKLFEAIAQAEGKQITTRAVTSPGRDWTYHLAQPVTAEALRAKTWTWVVLQDFSTRPTHIGNVPKFLQDGQTFSERIAQTSPHAGIVLYETWARPPGKFYQTAPGNTFSSPAQMTSELHEAYARLGKQLAASDKNREVRVAQVGMAFQRVELHDPEIHLDAADKHHATDEGYYLAALVIFRTIYHQTVMGAPNTFFEGALVIPRGDAAKLQQIAEKVSK